MKLFFGFLCSNLLGLPLLAWMLGKAKREGVPRQIRLLLPTVGGLLLLPVIFLQTIAGQAANLPLSMAHPLLMELFLFGIRLALVEELCKFCGTIVLTWQGDYFTGPYQGMLLAAAVALGFGILENLLFAALSLAQFPERFWAVMLARALLGAPGHGAYGVLMGRFYGIAKAAQCRGDKTGQRRALWQAVLIPTILHGLYDWLAGSQLLQIGEFYLLPGIAAVMDVVVILYAYGTLYRAAKKAQQNSAAPAVYTTP